jgi:hypothetical protein
MKLLFNTMLLRSILFSVIIQDIHTDLEKCAVRQCGVHFRGREIRSEQLENQPRFDVSSTE